MQLGIDYASVDGNSPPNFVRLRAAGARFVIIRKSYVLTDVKRSTVHLVPDAHYARDAANARAAGLTVGCYGFFSFALGAPSAADQVDALIRAAGEVVPGKDLPYCIDVEFPGRGIADTGRSQAQAFGLVMELVDEVHKRTGTLPLVYTSHVEWHDDNGLGGPDSPKLDGCPLWLKTPYRLVARSHLDPLTPRLPHIHADPLDPHDYWRVPLPWQRQGWWLHQYQGDVIGFPGVNMTVDVCQFQILDHTSHDPLRTLWLQRRLVVLGQPLVGPLNATGIWDYDTTYSLDAFQRTHGLQRTGIVDIATFASLCW